MTRSKALIAMKAGKKVNHHFFISNEYIEMKGNTIYTEDGFSVGTIEDEFWTSRSNSNWYDGWKYFNYKNDRI